MVFLIFLLVSLTSMASGVFIWSNFAYFPSNESLIIQSEAVSCRFRSHLKYSYCLFKIGLFLIKIGFKKSRQSSKIGVLSVILACSCGLSLKLFSGKYFLEISYD